MYLLMQYVSCRVFWQNIESPRWLSPPTAQIPKTKIRFDREEISDCQWDSGKYNRVPMVIGRTVWGPKVSTLKRTEASLSYVQCFLDSVSSSINVSSFPITWLDNFWKDLIYPLSLCQTTVFLVFNEDKIKWQVECKILGKKAVCLHLFLF